MVERITEKKLGDFQEFERWLDEKRLLDSEVLYRGHADSAWSLVSTLYRHPLTIFDAASPAFRFPIYEYTSVANEKLQPIVETHTDQRFDTKKVEDPFPTPPSRYPSDTQFVSDTTGYSHHFWTGLHRPT